MPPSASGRALEPPPPRHVARSTVRQIVSEYSVGTLQETASHDLHEFRQVISVDGRPVQIRRERPPRSFARHAVADDRIRKRMLEEFAKNGLVDIATDYGLILLEFTRRGWENLQFGPSRRRAWAQIQALVLAWKQISTAGGELEFHGRRAVRQPLEGRLWMRKSDGLPLRVEAWAELQDGSHTVRDQASVDYVMSSHGFLTPVSVVHRHSVDGQVMTENLYRTQPFKMFSADAEIKFTEVPEPRRAHEAMTRILYLHGFASGPGSNKARYFQRRLEAAGARVAALDLARGDFEHLTITGQLAGGA